MKICLAKGGSFSDELYKVIDIDPGTVLTSPENHLFAFLRKDTINDLKSFFIASNKDEVAENFNKISEFHSLWKQLLMDSIFFLRINDSRENAFWENPKDRQNKTTMSSGGIDSAVKTNVYGIEELFEYFKQFTKFESILYGADEHYRDHLLHPLNVWFIGLNILKKYGKSFRFCVNNGVSIENVPNANVVWSETKDSQQKVSIAELSAMWTITALTHDIGYPLEKVEKINDQLEKMLKKFGKIGFTRSRFNFEIQHDHLVRFLLNLISSVTKQSVEATTEKSWMTHLRTKYYTKFSKSWEAFDHGIVSSLILLKALTYFIESDYTSDLFDGLSKEDARQFAIRSEILHSIAAHTTPKIYHLTVHNLPFLLILCDELQEWSRPTFVEIREGMNGKANEVTIEKLEIGDDKSTIICRINYAAQPFKEQCNYASCVCKSWFERFRPALFDKDRSITFEWEMKFGASTSKPWIFTLETSKGILNNYSFKGPDKNNNTIDYELNITVED